MAGLWEPVNGVFTASASWLPNLGGLVGFGNSSFFTTLFGALAGAYFGAWAAQKIAKNEKTRDELTKEVRGVNAGIVLSYNTGNSAMCAYKQHIRALKASYDEDVAAYNALKETPPPRHLKISPKLMHLGTITTPIAALQQICMDQLSSNGMVIHTLTALAAAVDNLNSTIATHNSLIESYRRAEYPPGFSFEALYLGIPVNGKVNNIHGDTLNGLAVYANDVTFFALKLCDELREHGVKVLPKLKKATGNQDADISDIDYSDAILEGLVPQHEAYESWLTGFKKKESQERKPQQAKWWRFWRK